MSEEVSPTPMHTQRLGRVVAVLDGDAHLHVWEPNRTDDPIDCDLTDHVALLVDLGLDAPPATEPHWTDDGGSTVLVSLDTGAHGHIAVEGHLVSTEAAPRLTARGFLHLLRDAVERADTALLRFPSGRSSVEELSVYPPRTSSTRPSSTILSSTDRTPDFDPHPARA